MVGEACSYMMKLFVELTLISEDLDRYQNSKLFFQQEIILQKKSLDRKYHYDAKKFPLSYLGHIFHLEKPFGFEHNHNCHFQRVGDIYTVSKK